MKEGRIRGAQRYIAVDEVRHCVEIGAVRCKLRSDLLEGPGMARGGTGWPQALAMLTTPVVTPCMRAEEENSAHEGTAP